MTRTVSYRFAADDSHLYVQGAARLGSLIRIGPRDAGCLVFGPYLPLPPGAYKATVRFSSDFPCSGKASIDACAQLGQLLLAIEAIDSAKIVADGMAATLEFICTQALSDVEVRLGSEGGFTGAIESLEITGSVSEMPARIPDGNLPDLPEIGETMRALRPHRAEGFRKSRIGRLADGGYVLIDDFKGVDTALSFGIEADASWDLEMAARGMTVFQYDHTVDAPVTEKDRLVFSRKRIAAGQGDDCETLAALIERHDKRRSRPNLLLKLDIESDEWSVFDATPEHLLCRFTQIVGEFHNFEALADDEWRRLFHRVLSKLARYYRVVHVHGNNHAGFHLFSGRNVPNCMELTFANQSLYSLVETEELFPGNLDLPNEPNRPDIELGTFHF